MREVTLRVEDLESFFEGALAMGGVWMRAHTKSAWRSSHSRAWPDC
jgi:hypothetical protein